MTAEYNLEDYNEQGDEITNSFLLQFVSSVLAWLIYNSPDKEIFIDPAEIDKVRKNLPSTVAMHVWTAKDSNNNTFVLKLSMREDNQGPLN